MFAVKYKAGASKVVSVNLINMQLFCWPAVMDNKLRLWTTSGLQWIVIYNIYRLKLDYYWKRVLKKNSEFGSAGLLKSSLMCLLNESSAEAETITWLQHGAARS